MDDAMVAALLVVLTLVASLGAVLGLAGTVHVASRKVDGYFVYAVHAILLSAAVAILLSHRNLALSGLNAQAMIDAARSPIATWVQRGASVFLFVAAGERILSYLLRSKASNGSPPFLLAAFVVFWCCTVAVTALWGAYPNISHNYVYTLAIGVAAVLMGTRESQLAIKASRNAILLLIAVSVLLIPVLPGLVIDTSYAQGFLRGVPRFAGLTPHALSMGMLAQVALLLLWVCPLESTRLNRLGLGLASVAFFLAQSKTAWISFALAAVCMILTRHGAGLKNRFNDASRPAFGIGVIVVGMALVLGASAVLLLGDVGQKVSQLLVSDEGAQLASLTGRDQIWRVAFDEWHRHPVFGYGPGLFDETHRASIHMGNATNAHNQFVDTLARSGVVGATALAIYLLLLLVLSARYARSSGGLTLALFTIMALRSVSEVPMNLFSYGPESVLHLLLLMSLAGAARKAPLATPLAPGADLPERNLCGYRIR